jgi:hypothetical protein
MSRASIHEPGRRPTSLVTVPAVNRAGTERYKVTPEEVGETRFSVPCFLIAHPKGTLMWELGILPDDAVEARARGEQGNPTATAPTVTTVPRTLRSHLAMSTTSSVTCRSSSSPRLAIRPAIRCWC